MNNKLYIIGNGFDRYHGLPTGYNHFYRFLQGNHPDLLDRLEPYCEFKEDGAGLWTDFEQGLGTFLHNNFFSDINTIDIVNDDDVQWGWGQGVADDVAAQGQQLIDDTRTAFYEWLEEIELFEDSNPDIDLLPLNKNARFISFNYTDTLQLLYGIPDEQILHIHNCLKSSSDNLIFGHNIVLAEEPEIDEKGESNRTMFTDAENAAKSFHIALFKDTEAIIQKHASWFADLFEVNQIIVLGHSLNDIDLPYFEHLNKINSNVKWMVSYYCDSERERMHTSLMKIGISSEPSFIKMEEFCKQK